MSREFRQARWPEPLLFELEQGSEMEPLPEGLVPEGLERKELRLPELSEPRVIRHFLRLSQMNFGVDSGTNPLGSCTMKYNPKVSELLANLPEALDLHPEQPPEQIQGALRLMHELQDWLAGITGMASVSLQPAAGAHGEFTALLMVKAYHRDQGEEQRDEILLPDTAHGTNAASAAMAGYKVVELPSHEGRVDLEALKAALSDRTAAFMLTNPNTLGLFERQVVEIAEAVHSAGGLLYYDGANLNAIMDQTTPGAMGFDLVHLNLHKTFATPHGGGGPGAGPVGAVPRLAPYLPTPLVARDESGHYHWDWERPSTIGAVKGTPGNFGVLVRAYIFIRLLGREGLAATSRRAVLNANYLKARLADTLEIPYADPRKHEFVASGARIKQETGVSTLNLAKGLLDAGIHAPTIYFPLLVEEALMFEPTESESLDELDAIVEAMRAAVRQAHEDPESLLTAPHNLAVGMVDQVEAARKPVLSFRDMPARQDGA